MDRLEALRVLESQDDATLELLATMTQLEDLEPPPDHTDAEALMASATELNALKALAAELRRNQANWAANFGGAVLYSDKAVDQREVDYKRGYWAGARHYLLYRPEIAKRRVVANARRAETEGVEE